MRAFGRYNLIEHIAAGGMADVFLAEAAGAGGFRKQIAIKIVLPAFASGADGEEFLKMFMEEARLASRLTHANIVQVFDFDQVDGQYYIAMEYIRGRTLLQILEACQSRDIPLSFLQVAHIGAQVATALAYAHRLGDEAGAPLGLVHRDVSPQNVMISFEGEVKLADFGIAHARDSRTGTAPGMIKGKAAYMAPEQARGENLDGRADVFALAVVLWEALTGKQPFLRNSDTATLLAVIGPEPSIPPPSTLNPLVPPKLDGIVMRALERDPAKRTSLASELASQLSNLVLELSSSTDATDLRQLMVRIWPEEATPRPRASTIPGAAGAVTPGPAPRSGSGSSVPKTVVFDGAPLASSSRPRNTGANPPEEPAPVPPRRGAFWAGVSVVLALLAVISAVIFLSSRNSSSAPRAAIASAPSAAEPTASKDQPPSPPPPDSLSRDEPAEPPTPPAALPTPPPPVASPATQSAATEPSTSPSAPTRPAAPAERRAAKRTPHAASAASPPSRARGASASESVADQDASIEVTSAPYGVLFADDRRIGYTPATVTLKPGKHHLRVEREGFVTAEQSYVLRDGDAKRWMPRLQAAPR